MNEYCTCKDPSTFMRGDEWWCATCRKPLKAAEKPTRPAPKHVTLPPEKADALRAISNFRREVNKRLDELRAEVLKQ